MSSYIYSNYLGMYSKGYDGYNAFLREFPEDELLESVIDFLVNGNQSAGDSTIALDGFAGDGANRFKTGDFIKFASHNKVYMVVADVTSSSNAATVTIEPPLVADIANDSAVTYDNVPFTVHLTNDAQEFGAIGSDKDGNLLYKYELDVEETL